MAWSIEGDYFENCSCEVPCPCTVSLDMVAALGQSPKVMAEGNWKLGVLVSDNASDEQAANLGAVFGGELGGPMAMLGPLISENLGVDRVPMEIYHEDGTHGIRLGDGGEVEVQDVVPFGKENGEPARLTGVFHPAGDDLTIAKSTKSQASAFGVDFAVLGKSGLSSPFAWAG